MIREVKDQTKINISVETIDGYRYGNCDVPPQPFGENEQIVSFWFDDELLVIPMNRVKIIKLSFDD